MAFTVAIDATGVFVPVKIVVAGVIDAAVKGDISCILVGDSIEITRELAKFETLDLDISIHHIETRARENPKIAALERCVELASTDETKSIITFNNPRDTSAMALAKLGVFDGLREPAALKVIQLPQRSVIFLDIGASSLLNDERLVNLAKLGAAYASLRFELPNAKIMLLDNDYGFDEYKKAAERLEKTSLNFLGNAKPKALFMQDIDVLVADGYRGRIAYDTIESVSEFIYHSLKEAGKAKVYTQLGIPVGKKLWADMSENMVGKIEEGIFMAGCKKPTTILFRNITKERLTNALEKTCKFTELDLEESYKTISD